MRFFNIDLHVSVIEDIRDLFSGMGHEVVNWSRLADEDLKSSLNKEYQRFINENRMLPEDLSITASLATEKSRPE